MALDPDNARPRRWLGPLLLVGGIGLLVVGLVNLRQLIAAPLEAQRGFLASAVLPLVVGLWLVVGGVDTLMRRSDD